MNPPVHPSDDALLRYRYDTLEPAEKHEVSDHLRTCGACMERYAQVGKLLQRLEGWDAEAELDERLAQATLESVRARVSDGGAAPTGEPAPDPDTPPPASARARAAPPRPEPAREPQDDARPFPGFLAWLGVVPGAGFRAGRLAVLAAGLAAAAYVGGGTLYWEASTPRVNARITASAEALAGGRALVSVDVHDQKVGKPIAGAQVEATLVAGGRRLAEARGTTDAAGSAAVSLVVPADLQGQATLEVVTRARGETDTVRRDVLVKREVRVHLGSDKPLYQPGQTIHLRALALRPPSNQPAEGARATFELRDARGNRLGQKEVTLGRYGVAAWSFETSDALPLGEYVVHADVDGTRSELKLQLSRYALPKFKVQVAPDKDSWLAGETVNAAVRAHYFFGKPVANARVEVLLLKPDGTVLGRPLSGQTDAGGEWRFSVPLPSRLAAPGAPEPVVLHAEVKDSAGQEERKDHALTVSREVLAVELVAAHGGLSRGLDAVVYALTSTPDGRPVPCDVIVDARLDAPIAFRTGANGVGSFVLPAAVADRAGPGGAWLEVRVDDAAGGRTTRSLMLPVRERAYSLDTDRALYRAGDPIDVTLGARGAGPEELQVLVRRDGRVVSRSRLTRTKAVTTTRVVLPEGVSGPLDVQVESASGAASPAVAVAAPRRPMRRDFAEEGFVPPQRAASVSRRIVVGEAQPLQVSLTSDLPVYQPGASARLKFQVKDATGAPKAAALGVAVVDESLFALTTAKPSLVRAYFLLAGMKVPDRGQLTASDLAASGSPGEADQVAMKLLLAEVQPVAAVGTEFVASGFAERLGVAQRGRTAFGERAVWVVLLAGLLLAVVLVAAAGAWLWSWLSGLLLVGAGLGALVFGVPGGLVGFGLLVATCLAAGMHWHRHRTTGWGLVVLPGLLCLGLVLDVRGLRGLYAPLHADALSGETALRPRAPSPLQKKSLSAFGGPAEDYDSLVLAPAAAAPAPPAAMKLEAQGIGDLEGLAGAGVAFEELRAPERNAPGKMDARQKPRGAAQTGADEPEPPRREVRVRQFFPETLFVHPELIADETGVAELELPVADSITDWRVTALASSTDGRLGSLEQPLRAFQDFFVDVDAPAALVRGDVAEVPIAVHNYLGEPQTVRLEVERQSWFEVLGDATFSLKLGASEVGGVALKVRVLEPGRNKLQLRADGTRLSDAVARELLVTEAGEEKTVVVSGTLEAGKPSTVAVTLPAIALPGSARFTVKLYGSRLASALAGLEGALRAPHGCFEQTSSTTYPNVLIWDYLERTKQKTPQLEERARRLVSLGYQRLLGFEVQGGGFEWFGRAPANQVLTAYGLLQFRDMSRVYPVDERMMMRTQDFLVRRQRADGSWGPDAQSLADGLWKSGFDGDAMVTGYVAWSLAESGLKGPAMDRALDYLARSLDQVDDPYTLATFTAALARAKHPQAARAAAKLAQKAQRDGRQAWFAPAASTAYYGRGEGGTAETTGLAAYALMLADQAPEVSGGALAWLAAHRDGQGTWHSTQGTILALRALLYATRAETDQEVKVVLNGADLGATALKASSDQPATLDLAANAKAGANVVELTASAGAPFQVVLTYTQPWRDPGADERAPLALKLDWSRTRVDLGGIVPVDLKVTYRQPEPSGMVVVSFGLPAGLEPLLEDLEGLRGQGRLARYEVQSGVLNLYLDRLTQGAPVSMALRLKAAARVQTKGVGSVAYLYYHPEVRAVAPATAVAVN